MPVYDSSYAGDLLGWRADVLARVQDFLARKAVPATARVGALLRRIEDGVSVTTLKAALGDLVAYLRRESPAREALKGDEELEMLSRRILEYRRSESIENYTAYLFSVNLDL